MSNDKLAVIILMCFVFGTLYYMINTLAISELSDKIDKLESKIDSINVNIGEE